MHPSSQPIRRQHLSQLLQPHWLRQKQVNPARKRLLLRLSRCQPRQRKDGARFEFRLLFVLPDQTRRLEAAHDGHGEVHKDAFVCAGAPSERMDRFLAIAYGVVKVAHLLQAGG